jgi:hypothetical protein
MRGITLLGQSNTKNRQIKEKKIMRYKHKEFIKHYLTCFNGAEAYRKTYGDTDCAKNNCVRILKRPEVKKAIDDYFTATTDISKQEFIGILKNEHENPKNTPVTRLKALELLGKAKGYLSDTSTTQVAIINSINELEKRIKPCDTTS